MRRAAVSIDGSAPRAYIHRARWPDGRAGAPLFEQGLRRGKSGLHGNRVPG